MKINETFDNINSLIKLQNLISEYAMSCTTSSVLMIETKVPPKLIRGGRLLLMLLLLRLLLLLLLLLMMQHSHSSSLGSCR